MCIYLLIVAILSLNGINSQTLDDNFIKAVDNFAVRLFQKTTSQMTDNTMLSPLSVQSVLSLAMVGAADLTYSEMFYGLSFGNMSNEELLLNFNTWTSALSGNQAILTAFKAYVTDTYKLSPNFTSTITENFNSEVESIDFTENVKAANEINDWVKAKTNDRIKDLIDPAAIKNITRIILINTIYFKGTWLKKFDVSNTKPAKFYTSNVDFVTTDFMNIKDSYGFGVFPELEATAIRMSYLNTDMTMLILLPRSRTGLKKLKSNLHLVDWSQAYVNGRFTYGKVIVQLPKFSFDSKFELNDVLKRMGMTDMFTKDVADFSEMIIKTSETCNLYIDKVAHKTFISVNENGTEAAGATATMMVGSLPPSKAKSFIADHPFLFIMQSNEMINFIGQVTSF